MGVGQLCVGGACGCAGVVVVYGRGSVNVGGAIIPRGAGLFSNLSQKLIIFPVL